MVAILIIRSNFDKLEKNTVESNLIRVNRLLSSYSSDMTKTVLDWSEWDDTYQYAIDRNTNYENSNLVPSTFSTLKINLFAILDTSGKIVSVRMYDLSKQEFIDVPPLLAATIIDDNAVNLNGSEEISGGLIELPSGLMLFNAGPVLTSKKEGPARGTLIFGRYLDDTFTGEIAETANLDLTIIPVRNDNYSQVGQVPTGQDTRVVPINDKTIEGYSKIKRGCS